MRMSGKKPTVAQRKLIEKNSFYAGDWLVRSDTPERLVIVNRYTGAVKEIKKE